MPGRSRLRAGRFEPLLYSTVISPASQPTAGTILSGRWRPELLRFRPIFPAIAACRSRRIVATVRAFAERFNATQVLLAAIVGLRYRAGMLSACSDPRRRKSGSTLCRRPTSRKLPQGDNRTDAGQRPLADHGRVVRRRRRRRAGATIGRRTARASPACTAYVHDRTFDHSDGKNRRPRTWTTTAHPLRTRYQHEQAHEYAVLVGDFPSIDDPEAQQALERIKTLPSNGAGRRRRPTRRWTKSGSSPAT